MPAAMSEGNNFDLIRLLAALQVAWHHSIGHLGLAHLDGLIIRITDFFPGVPMFFFVSGFLISSAFERSRTVGQYTLNRVFRIYPALIFCFAVSVVSVWLSGYFSKVAVGPANFLAWTAAQLSFVQFYNPGFLRDYGVGILNGSLWTITVELQFYVLMPLLYRLFALRHASALGSTVILMSLIAVFLLEHCLYFAAADSLADALWYKVMGVSFAPWFYMFLTGVLFQKNFASLRAVLGGQFLPLALVYCAAAAALSFWAGWGLGNSIHPVLFVGLCLVIFSAAFSRTGLSDRLLRRNDISYGIYIFHMPVVNFLLYAGLGGAPLTLALALVTTVLLACLSWRLVEKPALALKRQSSYVHGAV